MGTSCHTYNGVKLDSNTYRSFSQAAFYEDGYNKINELSNYKRNLIYRFNTIRDMTTELGSNESFLKKWNSLLSLNGTLNIQFNQPPNIPISYTKIFKS